MWFPGRHQHRRQLLRRWRRRGPVTVTTDGAVVEGKNISGSVTVQASNVTIRNDCVTSSDIYPVHFVSGSNLTVEDTTITGTGRRLRRGPSSPRATAP